MEKEIWKEVPEFSRFYICSTYGRVKRIYNEKEYYLTKNYKPKGCPERFIGSINKKTKYLQCHLSKNGIAKTYYIHEIVAMTFLSYVKTNRKTCINHIDGNPSNNNLNNLEITSQSENVKDGFKRGRIIHNRGKKYQNARNSQILYVYDINMNYIGFFYGSIHAADILKLTACSIRVAAKRKNNLYGGFYFFYNKQN